MYTVHTCKLYEQADTHTTGLGPGGPSWLPYSFVVLVARARPRKAWGKAKAYAYGLSATHRNAKLCLNADTQRAYATAQSHRTTAHATAERWPVHRPSAATPALGRDADALQPPRSDSAGARIGGPTGARTHTTASVPRTPRASASRVPLPVTDASAK